MSESRDDGPPRNSGQSRTNGQADDSRPGSGSRSNRGSDPVADFQRWLMKAGARSMANQVADQVKRSLGAEKRDRGDVWDTATTEPPPNEPLECQWCPICQAARAARTSGPGLGTMLSDAGGALAGLAQGAFSAFEQLMKTPEQTPSAERTVVTPPPAAPDRGDAAQ
ncbi:MAG: hypothetical protein ACRDOU_21310 [Streptosporangiaceae bacterium]